MTKPRTRTHKIHRKRRGPKRGFKSRSQRGGEEQPGQPGYFAQFANLITGKKSDQDTGQVTGQASYQPTGEAPVTGQASYQPTGQVSNQPPYQPQVTGQNASGFILGGRKKCSKCKRHHKHSRRCKK